MIISRINSGLGNQMFQYAAGRSLAYIHKTVLKLDISDFGKNPQTNRAYSLGVFNIQENFATKQEIARLKINELNPIRRFLPNIADSFGLNNKPTHIRQRNLTTNFLAIPDETYLEGYWQSEKYFKSISAHVRREFTFKFNPTGLNAKLNAEIKSGDSVSMHIRRTDYLTPRSRKIYYQCPPSYFIDAAKKIAINLKKPRFYVFSDDPQWVRGHIKLKFPTVYVNHNSIDKGYEDLRLMAECKHNIIANSSFSWWGAWLNSHSNKIIIAPKKWSMNPKEDINDIIPLAWVKI